MKVWYGYGSEHSANLVMIGKFKDASDAAKAKQSIDWLTEQVQLEVDKKNLKIGERPEHFTKDMSDLLMKLNLYSIGPSELEQFGYDVRVEVNGNQVIVKTDEIDVSAFLKVLFDNNARIEIYSAHTYSGDKAEKEE